MSIDFQKTKTSDLANILWEYNMLGHALSKGDIILVLGSHDTRIAEYAADLFLAGYAPRIVFSGGTGRITKKWERSEAEVFADIAAEKGVPREKMLLETQSTNTGQNIEFTLKLLEEKDIKAEKVILVCKPYMERRAFATFKKWLPEAEVIVSSPSMPIAEYPFEDQTMDDVIHTLVGDTERIEIYAKRGFIIPQEMPDEVRGAYKELIRRGFDSCVLSP